MNKIKTMILPILMIVPIIFLLFYDFLVNNVLGVNNRFFAGQRIKNAYPINIVSEIKARKKRREEREFYFELRRGIKDFLKFRKGEPNPYIGLVTHGYHPDNTYYKFHVVESGLESFSDANEDWKNVESSVIHFYMSNKRKDYEKLLFKKFNIYKDIKEDLKQLDLEFRLKLEQYDEYLSENLWQKENKKITGKCTFLSFEDVLKLYAEYYVRPDEIIHDVTCFHRYHCRENKNCKDKTCLQDKYCDCVDVNKESDIYIKTKNKGNIYHFSISKISENSFKINHIIKYEPLYNDLNNELYTLILKRKVGGFSKEWSLIADKNGFYYSGGIGENLSVTNYSQKLECLSMNRFFYNHLIQKSDYFKDLAKINDWQMKDFGNSYFQKEIKIENSLKSTMILSIMSIALSKGFKDEFEFFKSSINEIKTKNNLVNSDGLQDIYDLTKMNYENINLFENIFLVEVNFWEIISKFLAENGQKKISINYWK